MNGAAREGSAYAGRSRYLRLLAIFWGSALATELEYRAAFVSSAALSLFWTGWAAAGVSVYFRFTDRVAGWSYPELLVVVGLFFTVNGVYQAVVSPNLSRMTEYVRQGTLDFLLTKPVDAQFLVSLRHVGVYNAFDPALGLVLAGVGVAASGRGVSVPRLGAFLLLMAAALGLLYAMGVVLMAVAVRLVSSEGLEDLLQGLVETARFPTRAYRAPVAAVLTVVPVAFLTTFPAEALLGRGDPVLLLVAPAAAVTAVWLASLAFRRSLRSYTGASA